MDEPLLKRHAAQVILVWMATLPTPVFGQAAIAGSVVDAIGGTFKIYSMAGAGTRLGLDVALSIEQDSSPVAV